MFLLLLLLAASPLDQGKKHFQDLEFEAAARDLASALAQPGLSREERREASDLRAQALLALGRGDEADAVNAELLRADPHAPAPEAAAPKVQASFLRAKQRVWPRPSVSLTRSPAPEGTLALELTDPWGLVKRVRWLETVAGTALERPSPPVKDHALAVTLAPDAQKERLEALASDGARLTSFELSLAAPAAALEVRAAAPPRWVTWALAGLSVAAAAAGATCLALGYQAPPPSFGSAAEASAWNAAATRNVALGWTFAGVAVGGGVAAAVMATR